jgi:hypothetical protein
MMQYGDYLGITRVSVAPLIFKNKINMEILKETLEKNKRYVFDNKLLIDVEDDLRESIKEIIGEKSPVISSN